MTFSKRSSHSLAPQVVAAKAFLKHSVTSPLQRPKIVNGNRFYACKCWVQLWHVRCNFGYLWSNFDWLHPYHHELLAPGIYYDSRSATQANLTNINKPLGSRAYTFINTDGVITISLCHGLLGTKLLHEPTNVDQLHWELFQDIS